MAGRGDFLGVGGEHRQPGPVEDEDDGGQADPDPDVAAPRHGYSVCQASGPGSRPQASASTR
jgi:hypothetical protein